MTFDPEAPAGDGTGAILRALGSLMAALGGDEARPPMRPAAPAPRAPASPYQSPPYQSPQYPPQYQTPQYQTPPYPAPQYQTPPYGAPRGSTPRNGEVELLLSEARERAERILQDSMERARGLLARDRGADHGVAGGEDAEPLRRSVDELLLGMRDVQARLARIESSLAAARFAPPLTPAQRPAFPPPAAPLATEDDRRPGVLSVMAPQGPASPPVLPPSAVPPMRAGAQATSAPRPAPEEQRAEAREAGEAQAWQRGQEGAVAGTLATFTPADGSVLLRAAPVSGFQGLMRLQEALQRIPAVRQATVEAYSQGEARLRLELASEVDSDEIAEGVSAVIGQNARVREASEADRSIVIAFG